MENSEMINDMLDVITRHIGLAKLNERQIAREPEQYLKHIQELLCNLGEKVGAAHETSIQFSISPYSRPRVVFQMARPPQKPDQWRPEYMQSELGSWVRYVQEIGIFQIELWSMGQ